MNANSMPLQNFGRKTELKWFHFGAKVRDPSAVFSCIFQEILMIPSICVPNDAVPYLIKQILNTKGEVGPIK